MKQKLIALLKTSFASKGFNAKELDSLADLIIAQNVITETSTDEDLSTAVTAATPTADLIQSIASRQVSEAVKPKAVEPVIAPVIPVVEPVAPVTTDPVLLVLLAEIKELKTGFSALNTEKVANTQRERYIESMKGTSKEYQAKELKRFDRMKFDKPEDFDAFLEDTKDDHAAAIQEDSNADLGNDRPAGGTAGKAGVTKLASDAELDAVETFL